MQNVTREQIDILVSLQEIDIKSVVIRDEMDSLPGRRDELDAKLKEAEERFIQMDTAHSELKKIYRSNESDIQQNQEKIRKSNEKLVSVKTNKEYQAILKEIEDLNKKNSGMEDEMIKNLDLMEAEEKRILEYKEQVQTIKEGVDAEKKALEAKLQEGERALAEFDKEWQSIAEKLDPELMKRYNTIREQIKGKAIAGVHNAICGGCYMNIPPQLYNELQRYDDLKYCPHCHRIIYWEE